ncbi:MarC family protein [Thioalkalivibrio thiocyanodenitrificans]|uniref:MarC family protein n=1 Tax=Thioalkalivibrio thiocyanodenitrificans TaxID=243063 RepID=UPI00037CDFD5|nr:MarC family protein [Thioalkalivibrio thiocyanodenitrificans]
MLEILLSAFVLLFIVVDPIGVAAIFAALVHDLPREEQRRIARNGVLLAAGILLTFMLVGNGLLSVLGISIPAFRVAGGVLLFMLSLDMIFARQSGMRATTLREQREASRRQDISVFPLAFPLIAGPGAMTTVLLMASAGHPPGIMAALVGVVVLVLALCLLAFRLAPSIIRGLGETGINVVNRLLGLILAALAVQFILDGVRVGLNLD